MIDSPKAIHFTAWAESGKLHWNDPVGLQYCWAAARTIQQEITGNMINASDEVLKKIRERLATANAGRAVQVVLARDESPFTA